MTERLHLQDAHGVVTLTAAHVSAAKTRIGLESLTVFRWVDEADASGQDTTARLVNYLNDHPGMVVVLVDGEHYPVVPSVSGVGLETRGVDRSSDPLLELPRFSGH